MSERPCVIYITRDAHKLLRVIVAKRGDRLGQWVEDRINEAAVRELGDEVHKVLGTQAEHESEIPCTSPNPSPGDNGSLGKAKKREDVLGS